MTLSDFKKTKEFLVCVDSDGCLLDNMELKHKECFCTAFVNVWDLQAVSRYAREVWEFVNLYSKTRGTNRFPALVRALELTYARPEVKECGIEPYDITALKAWCEETNNFSESALEAHIATFGKDAPADLKRALDWSREVNANVRHIVRNIGPFPGVREALAALSEFANVVVVSSTPQEALIRELTNVDIIGSFDAVAGQESGTKAICIAKAMEAGFDAAHTLKVGDAPGDYAAAQANSCNYYPIIPGKESFSWKRLKNDAAALFAAGIYADEAMGSYVGEFYQVLPDEPSWN